MKWRRRKSKKIGMIRRFLRIVMLLPLLIVVCYSGIYYVRGQALEDFPEQIFRDAQRILSWGGTLPEQLATLRKSGSGYLEDGDSWFRSRWASFKEWASEYELNDFWPTAEPGTTESQTGDPAYGSGSVQVFFGPADPEEQLGIDDDFLAYLETAQESIDAAFYDLQWMPVADVLIEKHHQGVDINLVSDSHYEDREAMQQCLAAGIPVVFDERSSYMHNKFAVVDGEQIWTGSTNITENGLYRNNNNALRVDSTELATNFTHEFAEMFYDGEFGATSPVNTAYPELVLDEVVIQTYFAPEDGVEEVVVREISTANEHIDFMLFSFTSVPIAEAMAARIDAGVSVRGLFERRNAGSEYSRDDYLEEAGAAVYMDTNPNTMHHKVMVVDGDTVVTGSYNFSNNAETRNDENVLIIRCPEIAAAYTAEFESLIISE